MRLCKIMGTRELNLACFTAEMGVLLLDVLCCVMALEQDFLATFPMTFASCLLYCQPSPQWEEASDEIMSRLCYYVLPMCLGVCVCVCVCVCVYQRICANQIPIPFTFSLTLFLPHLSPSP